MAFGQMTHREILSDTMLYRKANTGKLYHLTIGNPISVSTISRANETRSKKIYETLDEELIRVAKDLYNDEKEKHVWLHSNVFAIDAKTIDLSVTAFCGRYSELNNRNQASYPNESFNHHSGVHTCHTLICA
jgi:hypothetical protein